MSFYNVTFSNGHQERIYGQNKKEAMENAAIASKKFAWLLGASVVKCSKIWFS